jgi:hypothetical protein
VTIPDPFSDEPTSEIDPELWYQYLAAREAADVAKEKLERLKNEVVGAIGDAHAGTVDGRKVATFRPKRQWAEAALIQAYPDLARHFMRTKVTEVLDLPAFMERHPDIVNQFQVRAFRLEI